MTWTISAQFTSFLGMMHYGTATSTNASIASPSPIGSELEMNMRNLTLDDEVKITIYVTWESKGIWIGQHLADLQCSKVRTK